MIKTRTYKNYLFAATTTVLFVFHCVTVTVSGEAETWEHAYYMAREFVSRREWVFLVTRFADFVLIAFGVMGLFRIDKWDIAMMALVILSQTITVFDYSANGNTRDVNIDYWAFAVAFSLIWILKICDIELLWNRLFNFRKTRR